MKVSRSETFLWLGNSPALDFVNTQIVQAGAVTDLLASGKDFLLWLREAGLLPANARLRQSGPALDLAVKFARQYRAQIRQGLEQLITQGSITEELIFATNRLLAAGAHAVRLVPRSRRFELQHVWRVSEPAAFSAPIAYALATLLSSGDLSRIRRCRNPRCVLFFYDSSRSGTRSWCSLDICGNKLRIAAFRRRHRRQRKPALSILRS